MIFTWGDVAFRGDASLPNPEQLLVAAASSCQMLSFLAVAGYFLQDHYALVERWVEPLAWVVVGVAAGGYAAHLAYAFRRSRRRRQQQG